MNKHQKKVDKFTLALAKWVDKYHFTIEPVTTCMMASAFDTVMDTQIELDKKERGE